MCIDWRRGYNRDNTGLIGRQSQAVKDELSSINIIITIIICVYESCNKQCLLPSTALTSRFCN
jgi:hypothetical protein